MAVKCYSEPVESIGVLGGVNNQHDTDATRHQHDTDTNFSFLQNLTVLWDHGVKRDAGCHSAPQFTPRVPNDTLPIGNEIKYLGCLLFSKIENRSKIVNRLTTLAPKILERVEEDMKVCTRPLGKE
ncbi:hypothetical protein ABEB36_014835 [Hypothenemus hampei]|uniref:Uncharacterized protein n=1 Tax=Hypothenemus hampei TaxID=57062 RepID=A0ABD1E111_HYPHA